MPSPPPGLSERDFQAALRELEGVVGREWLFSSDEDVLLYRDGYSPLWGEAEERMASAAVAPNPVEQVQGIVKIANQYGLPLYPISTGRNLTLRRRGARVLGQRRRGSEAHEPHPRRQRARQDLPRRARRQLLRSLPSLAHEQDPALDRYGRSGLGRARRQRARPRRRLHGHRISRPLRRALRHGGRAADGRGRAHRHGRQPAGQDLAAVQVRLGSVGRRHFLAVEFRHRDEDGFLAHGGTRGRAAGRGYRAEAPRRRAARRHVAQLDVRAHGAVAGQRREPADGRQQRRDAAVARLGRGVGRAVGPVRGECGRRAVLGRAVRLLRAAQRDRGAVAAHEGPLGRHRGRGGSERPRRTRFR